MPVVSILLVAVMNLEIWDFGESDSNHPQQGKRWSRWSF